MTISATIPVQAKSSRPAETPISRGQGPQRVRAFTLVEMIVVIIILGVFAGVALPRLFGNDSRRVEVETQTVQRLFSIAAERESLLPEPVAISYDGDSATFRILVRRKGAAFVTKRSGSDDKPRIEWTNDSLVLPVPLTYTTVSEAWMDGRPLPKRGWRVEFSPSQPRPVLAIQLESKTVKSVGGGDAGTKPVWQVTLGPDDAAAVRTSVKATGGAPPLVSSRAIDLDAAGKGQKSW